MLDNKVLPTSVKLFFCNKKDFQCNFCEEKFRFKKDVMLHQKKEHHRSVANCWNYFVGKCDFDQNDCWFNHDEISETSRHFKCNECEEIFVIKAELNKHMKQNHKENVSECKQDKLRFELGSTQAEAVRL